MHIHTHTQRYTVTYQLYINHVQIKHNGQLINWQHSHLHIHQTTNVWCATSNTCKPSECIHAYKNIYIRQHITAHHRTITTAIMATLWHNTTLNISYTTQHTGTDNTHNTCVNQHVNTICPPCINIVIGCKHTTHTQSTQTQMHRNIILAYTHGNTHTDTCVQTRCNTHPP